MPRDELIERLARPGEGQDVIYPVSDDMGQSGLQWVLGYYLADLLRYFFECFGRTMLVGGNQFIYYRQGDPSACIAPDVYLIENEPTPVEEVKSWKVWERGGKVPSLVVEIVSDEYLKDYKQDTLDRYQEMGVRELFRYDPDRDRGPRRLFGRTRKLLSHFVRDEAGRLVERELKRPERAASAQYDFWLMHRAPRTLRVGYGPEGLAVWPTRMEAEAQRADVAEKRAEAEAQRAEVEAQRAEALQAELERLRAKLGE